MALLRCQCEYKEVQGDSPEKLLTVLNEAKNEKLVMETEKRSF